LKFKDSDPTQAENNKEIFYHRIEALINHMQNSLIRKKTI